MWVDTHIHILPCIDDGASSLEESSQIFLRLKEQGVRGLVATPHFYHEKESIERFMLKRKSALTELRSFIGNGTRGFRFVLSAEVHISQGVSSIPSLNKLCIKNTKYLPIELPVANLDMDSYLEICNIIHKHRLYPLVCNFERCIIMYSEENLKKVMGLPHASFNINALSFTDKKVAKIALEMHMSGKPIFVCTNSHNTQKRPPDVLEENIPLDDVYCKLVYKRICDSNAEFFKNIVFS